MKYTLTACVMVLCLPVSATQDDDEAPDFSHIDRTKFNREMIHNKGHINKHYEGKADLNMDEMSSREVEFVFFKEHDYNEDGRLDGLELLQALQHEMPFHTNEDNMENLPYVERKKRRQQWQQQWLEQITTVVDSLLAEEDLDNDGYLSYAEFKKARSEE